MFEDLIAQLDEMGVPYNEDYEAGTLTIDISNIDKADLVDVIIMLNNSGETFDISESSIVVQGGEATEIQPETEETPDYMNEALGQLQ